MWDEDRAGDGIAADVESDLVELMHRFAENEMRPVAHDYEEREEFPWPVVRKAAALGILSVELREDLGGAGIESLLTSVRIAEELAWGDPGIAGCLAGNGFFGVPVQILGDEDQCRRWIPRLCSPDDPVVAALALTEPEAGSDATALRTHARRDGDRYIVNGQKTWISCAPEAELYLVFATVDPSAGARGITAFVVERGDPGFTVGRKLPKLGTRCYPAAELYFEDCELPLDRRLGAEGLAFPALMRYFDRSRVQVAANALGIARAALEYGVQYAKERQTFGRPIHEYQAVSFRLVDAKLKVDQARLMTQHAARLADAGKPMTVEASMAKVAAAEAAWYTTWACVQTLGGYGYSREYPAERWLRAAKLEEIYEGTSDIQRLVVARALFSE